MKHLLLILITTFTLFAEATFDQVQSMIDKQQYKQAVLALTIIDSNHPNSSKVQYTLAQAYAGLGNLPAAREALDKAIAINPKLDFVPDSQVAALTQAITPQTKLVTKVESETYFLEWFLALIGVTGLVIYFRPKSKAFIRPEVPKPTPAAEPKPDYKPYSKPTKSTYTPPKYNSNYASTSHSKPAEVHHHHHSDSTMSTIVTAGLTAAAVSTLMDDDKPTYEPTHSYEPETTSSSWNDTSSDSLISSSWDDSSSSSSSWDDSSSTSSSSNSWSSSSDSSSSSSWND